MDLDSFDKIVSAAYGRLWGDGADDVQIARVLRGTWIINNWLVVDVTPAGAWNVYIDMPPEHAGWQLACLKRANRVRVQVAGPYVAILQVLRHEGHLRAHQVLDGLFTPYAPAVVRDHAAAV